MGARWIIVCMAAVGLLGAATAHARDAEMAPKNVDGEPGTLGNWATLYYGDHSVLQLQSPRLTGGDGRLYFADGTRNVIGYVTAALREKVMYSGTVEIGELRRVDTELLRRDRGLVEMRHAWHCTTRALYAANDKLYAFDERPWRDGMTVRMFQALEGEKVEWTWFERVAKEERDLPRAFCVTAKEEMIVLYTWHSLAVYDKKGLRQIIEFAGKDGEGDDRVRREAPRLRVKAGVTRIEAVYCMREGSLVVVDDDDKLIWFKRDGTVVANMTARDGESFIGAGEYFVVVYDEGQHTVRLVDSASNSVGSVKIPWAGKYLQAHVIDGRRVAIDDRRSERIHFLEIVDKTERPGRIIAITPEMLGVE